MDAGFHQRTGNQNGVPTAPRGRKNRQLMGTSKFMAATSRFMGLRRCDRKAVMGMGWVMEPAPVDTK